jgi:predicted RNA methylase
MTVESFKFEDYNIKYVFEPPEYDSTLKYFSRWRPKSGDTVVDAGAYTGITFSLIAAKMVGETGKIIAFEPDPFNYGRLIYNAQLNNINNIKVMPMG